MDTLKSIYDTHKRAPNYGDKGTVHTYIQEYELLFKPFRNGCTLLEIGVYQGGSILMWDDYFTDSHIIGVDINDPEFEIADCKNKVTLIKANATQPVLLDHLGDVKLDIVIDDGSHNIFDMVASFELIKDRMNKGGIYIIEDVQQFDVHATVLAALHPSFQFIDNRSLHGRYDDVLAIYTF